MDRLEKNKMALSVGLNGIDLLVTRWIFIENLLDQVELKKPFAIFAIPNQLKTMELNSSTSKFFSEMAL